jgi:hypothetical protein
MMKNSMPKSRWISVAIGAVVLQLSGCAHEHASTQPTTVSLQGGPIPTCRDDLVRGFYQITVDAFSNGVERVDLSKYEAASFAYFRTTPNTMGLNSEQLVDHLKDIPRQLVQIAKDDPKVIESCENFILALAGPP